MEVVFMQNPYETVGLQSYWTYSLHSN